MSGKLKAPLYNEPKVGLIFYGQFFCCHNYDHFLAVYWKSDSRRFDGEGGGGIFFSVHKSLPAFFPETVPRQIAPSVTYIMLVTNDIYFYLYMLVRQIILPGKLMS